MQISLAPPTQILHVVDRLSPIPFWVTCKYIQCTDQNVLAATFYVAGSSDEEKGFVRISSLQPTCSPVAHDELGGSMLMLFPLLIFV